MASLIGINLIIFYIWTYFSIFCDGMVSFIFGKLAGMSPYLVKVGMGYTLFIVPFFNAKFEFKIFPYTGVCYARNTSIENFNDDGFKARYIFYMMGGVFANFILLMLLLNELRIKGSLIIWILIIWQILLLFSTLIPSDIEVDEKLIPNDGKQLIVALTTNYKKIFKDVIQEFNQQLYKYKNEHEVVPKPFLSNDLKTLKIFIKAQTKGHSADTSEEAVELFIEVLRVKDISNSEKAFILDNLCCMVTIYGHKKYLKDADKWSQEAIKLASHCKTLKGTRGAILIELGKYEEGKQLLLPLTEPDNEALDIAVSSCYIAKAEYFIGNIDSVNDWFLKARKLNTAATDSVLKRIQKELNYTIRLTYGCIEPGSPFL